MTAFLPRVSYPFPCSCTIIPLSQCICTSLIATALPTRTIAVLFGRVIGYSSPSPLLPFIFPSYTFGYTVVQHHSYPFDGFFTWAVAIVLCTLHPLLSMELLFLCTVYLHVLFMDDSSTVYWLDRVFSYMGTSFFIFCLPPGTPP
jgi:hypothetical protein